MIVTILALILIGGGLITSIIFPVHLPANVIAAVEEVANALWGWDGILPIGSWISDLNYIFYICVLFAVFKIVMGIIGLATGGGKPEA